MVEKNKTYINHRILRYRANKTRESVNAHDFFQNENPILLEAPPRALEF